VLILLSDCVFFFTVYVTYLSIAQLVLNSMTINKKLVENSGEEVILA
jgi:hypothetical protein